MPQGKPMPGERYLHFKKKLYQIIAIARHSETGEELVIYQALYGTFQIYARPLALFISPVDKEKYPQEQQRFRFQLVEPQETYQESEAPQSRRTAESAAYQPSKKDAKASAEDKLMAFFDAQTMEEKYRILADMREEIDDRMINNMAVVLDVVVDEGPLEQRYEELKNCVRTFQRYECNRLR